MKKFESTERAIELSIGIIFLSWFLGWISDTPAIQINNYWFFAGYIGAVMVIDLLVLIRKEMK